MPTAEVTLVSHIPALEMLLCWCNGALAMVAGGISRCPAVVVAVIPEGDTERQPREFSQEVLGGFHCTCLHWGQESFVVSLYLLVKIEFPDTT